MGDSISAGYGIKESENWVSLLQSEFDKEILQIFNSSVSGETTIGGLTRISTALDKFSPDIVLIELGGNDALRGYPPTRIKDNLKNIIFKNKRKWCFTSFDANKNSTKLWSKVSTCF